MAIFSSRNDEEVQSQGIAASKTEMEYTEDLEATRSRSKTDQGHIERVELTAEDVCFSSHMCELH